MNKKIFGALAALCFGFMSLTANATYDTKSNDQIPLSKEVKTGQLDNGFKYFIMKNAKPDKHAHFRIVLNAGAICEDDDQNGLAHFTEHMCFNGTKSYPKNQLLDVLQKFGIRFGADVNASTGQNLTMYELPIPIDNPKLLKESFNILKEWAGSVTMEADDINGERDIIMSEWRQRNNAMGRINDLHAPVEYEGSKYSKRNVIGDTFILKNFRPEVIRRFYKDWYRPDLMCLVAVGDFDVDQIEKMTKEYFGKLENPKNERPREVYDVPFNKDLRVSIASDIEMPFEMAQFTTRFNLFDENTFKGYAQSQRQQLFSMMLGERLNDLANDPNDPPYLAAGAYEGYETGNKRAFNAIVRTKNGGLERGMKAILTEIARVKQHGFTIAEFERAKTNYVSMLDNIKAQKATATHDGYVNELTYYFMKYGSMGGADFDVEYSKQILNETGILDINNIAKRYLTDENTTIFVSLPEKPDATKISKDKVLDIFKKTLAAKTDAKVEEVALKPLFDKKITPGKITKEVKNEKLGIETLTLSNGAKVVLKPTDFKENQILFSAYSFGGTSLYNDPDFYSAAISTDAAEEGGLSEFNKIDLGKVLTGKSISLSPYVNDLNEGFQGSSNKKDLETMFQLLYLYVMEPRADKSAFHAFLDKVKPQLKAQGETQDGAFRDSVNWIMADHHFRKQPVNVKFLENAEFDRAFKIYKERFSNINDFTFFLVGDFDVNEAKEYFAKYVATLPSGAIEKYKDQKVSAPKKPVDVRFKKGEADRSLVRLSIPGEIQYTQENRQRLNAVIEALEIRLIETIREKMSGTYSPSIWLEMNKYPTPGYKINIQFVTEPKRVDELIEGCRKVLADFVAKPDEEAADKVKKAQVAQRVLDLKNNGYWMSMLSSYSKNGEDYSTIANWDKLINSINAKDLNKYAKKYINLKNMSKIVAMPDVK